MSQGKRKVQVIDEELGGWETMDGNWNPSDFIISGQDHQGHSERIFCRVQPQHERAGQIIMKSGKFPFKTHGDLVRWAYVRGLKVLDRLEPMPGFMGAADSITEILRQESYYQEFHLMFAVMEKVMNIHISNGAKGEARKLLSKILLKVRGIDDDHWRKTCEKDIKQRFGHLLEGAGKGKVGKSDPDEDEGEDD